MTTRHEYIEKFKDKLDSWEADLDELEASTQKTREEFKRELDEQMISLRIKRDIARAKLSEIREASEDAWQDLKQGAEEAWDDLKIAIEKARSHF